MRRALPALLLGTSCLLAAGVVVACAAFGGDGPEGAPRATDGEADGAPPPDGPPSDAAAPGDAGDAGAASRPLDCDGSVLCTGFETFPAPWDGVDEEGSATLELVRVRDGGTLLEGRVSAGAARHDRTAKWQREDAFATLPGYVRIEATIAVDTPIQTTTGFAELLFVRLGAEQGCAYVGLVLGSNNDLRANFSSDCTGGTQHLTVPLATSLQNAELHHLVLDMPIAPAAPRVWVDDAPQIVSGALARTAQGQRLLVKVGVRSSGPRPAYRVLVDDLVVRGIP